MRQAGSGRFNYAIGSVHAFHFCTPTKRKQQEARERPFSVSHPLQTCHPFAVEKPPSLSLVPISDRVEREERHPATTPLSKSGRKFTIRGLRGKKGGRGTFFWYRNVNRAKAHQPDKTETPKVSGNTTPPPLFYVTFSSLFYFLCNLAAGGRELLRYVILDGVCAAMEFGRIVGAGYTPGAG